MEVPRREDREERSPAPGTVIAIFRAYGWRIAGISIAAGLVTMAVMITRPDLYQASATITPSIEDPKPHPALGAIGALGIQVGGPSKVEDLESLFKSRDLTVRVFSRNDLWAIVFPGRYDPEAGVLKPGWTDRRLGRSNAGPPGNWDAVRAAQESLAVTVNRRLGTVTVAFESQSPQGSADIVGRYLDEAKSRLQEEAFDRANRNKKFIEEQINRPVDVLTRERLFALLGQEMEKEMMARNREQFGFRVIDAPMVPDSRSRPRRLRVSVLGTLAALILSYLYFNGARRKRQPE
jgi:uncharacterized protein involved in exopolysaccharide biosynthesis